MAKMEVKIIQRQSAETTRNYVVPGSNLCIDVDRVLVRVHDGSFLPDCLAQQKNNGQAGE